MVEQVEIGCSHQQAVFVKSADVRRLVVPPGLGPVGLIDRVSERSEVVILQKHDAADAAGVMVQVGVRAGSNYLQLTIRGELSPEVPILKCRRFRLRESL